MTPTKISNAVQKFQTFMHKDTQGFENRYVYVDPAFGASHWEKQLSVDTHAVFGHLNKKDVLINAPKCELQCPALHY